MNVSGVGENKYLKYGERFISVIAACVEEYPQLLQDKAGASDNTEHAHEMARKKTDKQEYFLLREEAMNFKYAEYMYISEIRDEMNRICERDNIKKLPAMSLTELLIAEGYIVKNEQEGKYAKAPTEKGSEQGIRIIEKVSQKGINYTVLSYPPSIQKMLVEHFVVENNGITLSASRR